MAKSMRFQVQSIGMAGSVVLGPDGSTTIQRVAVNFVQLPDEDGSVSGGNSLNLNMDGSEATSYFPGDVYVLQLSAEGTTEPVFDAGTPQPQVHTEDPVT